MVVGGEEGGKNDDDDDNNAEKTTPTQWFVKLSLATMGACVFYCPQPHKERLPRVIETHTWTQRQKQPKREK